MSQVLQKREKYEKVSESYKMHFNTRNQKIEAVMSDRNSIENRISHFNALINDTRHPKSTKKPVRIAYLRQLKNPKGQLSQTQALRKFSSMIDGFKVCSQTKPNKNSVFKPCSLRQHKLSSSQANFLKCFAFKESFQLQIPKIIEDPTVFHSFRKSKQKHYAHQTCRVSPERRDSKHFLNKQSKQTLTDREANQNMVRTEKGSWSTMWNHADIDLAFEDSNIFFNKNKKLQFKQSWKRIRQEQRNGKKNINESGFPCRIQKKHKLPKKGKIKTEQMKAKIALLRI